MSTYMGFDGSSRKDFTAIVAIKPITRRRMLVRQEVVAVKPLSVNEVARTLASYHVAASNRGGLVADRPQRFSMLKRAAPALLAVAAILSFAVSALAFAGVFR